jgi:hypothetical protein
MKKLLTVAAAGALAVGVSVAATAPSQAFFPPGGLFVAGVAGFMAGAVIASAAEHDQWDRGGESWNEHVAACEQEYGWRYDPNTNLVHRH